MTRLLVLGARGFLGAHVVAAARAHPDISSVLAPPRSELDLDDGVGRVRDVLARTSPDAVVLCTGRLGGTVSELTLAHAGAVATLVDALCAIGRPVRLVRLGSAGEYGPVARGRSVREDDPTWPVTAYGASHLAATHLLRTASSAGPVTGTTLRIFNPVGSGGHGPSLVAQTVARIQRARQEGAREIVTAPLTTWRDLVDAEDVAAAALAAALLPDPPPPVVNVGSGRAVPMREVVDLLATLAGWHGQVREDAPAPERSAGVAWMQADVTLARQVLGWQPRRSLVDSLRDAWADTSSTSSSPPLLTKDAS